MGSAEPPYDPWDWLQEQPYAGYEWLESPGSHLFGAWQLVESNEDAPPVALLAGFGAKWGLDACSSGLGRVVTSSEGNVTLTVDTANPECAEATDAVEQLVLSVIRENGGGFEVSSEGDERMTWRSPTGDTLVWQRLDESFEPEPLYPVDPASRSEIYEIWARSTAPEMEGICHLREVGNEDPAAPVSINVGVSTIGFEGQCNDMGGMFAVSSDNRLALSLYSTAAGCSGPTGEVEEQMQAVLSENDQILQVSVEDDTMTWANETGPQMVWSR